VKNWLNNPRLRATVIILVLLVTVALFGRYFWLHPQAFSALSHISLATVLWILLLNAFGLLALAGINNCLLRFCGVQLGLLEQFQLTSYSAIANFFGPLQSGPGVRAVYLKAKHNVRLRDYALASLIYYALFAVVSAVFLFGFSLPWWQTLLLVLLVGAVGWAVMRLFRSRDSSQSDSGFRFDIAALTSLLVLVVIQVAIIALWYFVELKAVAPLTTLRQAFIYAGAANFALFVSLTPDAIGFRESFLLLAQHLHGISTSSIVSANVIDRAVYVAFLGGLFLVVLATHAGERFKGLPKSVEVERQ